ncbi:MAG: hypothetical protein KA371_06310 [Acidobacteria bacterium]|nr:hypothetical protein [Acidobacteriota bacterium]
MDTPGPSQHPFSPLSLAADRDRRSQPRLSAEVLGLEVDATLSQGVYVRVLNVSTGGALIELHEWIRPGTKSALKLSRPLSAGVKADRMVASGLVVRCWVDRLAPLRYRAAMVFASPAPEQPRPDAAAPDTDLTVLLERPA